MRLAQINSVCGFGSTGKIMVDIHKIATLSGMQSKMYYGRGPIYKDVNAIKFTRKPGILLHTLLTRIFDKHGFGSKHATRKLISNLREYQPDIVHLHNIHGYYLNIKILFNYFKENNIKVVWTLHDCWPFTGHCAYFDYPENVTTWIDGMHTCHTKKSYPHSMIFNREKKNRKEKKEIFSNVPDLTIVTPSKWLKNLVGKSYLRKYRVEVINNGIDLDIFKPIKSDFKDRINSQDKKIILGVASGWEPRKGLNYFLELANVIDQDEIIVLVGLKPDSNMSLPRNIIAIPRTNSAIELAEIYSAADVFVNPTLEDNYPTTNLEAQACGTKVVTFETGGSPEGVFYSNGIIVKEKNTENLYKAIKKIFEDKDEINFNLLKDKIDKTLLFRDYLIIYQDKNKEIKKDN